MQAEQIVSHAARFVLESVVAALALQQQQLVEISTAQQQQQQLVAALALQQRRLVETSAAQQQQLQAALAAQQQQQSTAAPADQQQQMAAAPAPQPQGAAMPRVFRKRRPDDPHPLGWAEPSEDALAETFVRQRKRQLKAANGEAGCRSGQHCKWERAKEGVKFGYKEGYKQGVEDERRRLSLASS